MVRKVTVIIEKTFGTIEIGRNGPMGTDKFWIRDGANEPQIPFDYELAQQIVNAIQFLALPLRGQP